MHCRSMKTRMQMLWQRLSWLQLRLQRQLRRQSRMRSSGMAGVLSRWCLHGRRSAAWTVSGLHLNVDGLQLRQLRCRPS